MRERIEAIREIWTKDNATYHRRFVNVDLVTSWPKPVQRPYLPILVAGNGPRAFELSPG